MNDPLSQTKAGPVTIAVDCMGGDAGPGMVYDGVRRTLDTFPDASFLLMGDGEAETLLASYPAIQERATFSRCERVVSSSEKPSQALRTWQSTSMGMAVAAVRDNMASFAISAGNTGALMGMALFGLRPLPFIDRPAIAAIYPTETGRVVFLDLGANVHADARNLVQFAVLGDLFARYVLGVERPSIGLLNIGSEAQKGRGELKEASELLESFGDLNFAGFVEAFDLTEGKVDVVVTDGFTGNICLKLAEGAAKQFTFFLKRSVRADWRARLGFVLARAAMLKFRNQMDPRRYNGAAFLGLRGLCIKSHGGTDGFGFANAIGVGVNLARMNYLSELEKKLAVVAADGMLPSKTSS